MRQKGFFKVMLSVAVCPLPKHPKIEVLFNEKASGKPAPAVGSDSGGKYKLKKSHNMRFVRLQNRLVCMYRRPYHNTRLTRGDGAALGRLLQYFYNAEFCGVWKLKFRRKVHCDSGSF